jgi:hypothetical protein
MSGYDEQSRALTPRSIYRLTMEKKKSFFFTSASPGSLKTLNRLCSNNSAFQVDRGVSEGFLTELARDSTW